MNVILAKHVLNMLKDGNPKLAGFIGELGERYELLEAVADAANKYHTNQGGQCAYGRLIDALGELNSMEVA